MKRVFTTVSVLLVASILFAQAPQAFKYQFVVRNNAGEILPNQAIGVRITIHEGTATGPVIYQEEHSSSTNQFGHVSLEIGTGAPASGDFHTIDWGFNDKFIQTEVDVTGGTNFVNMGTSQLLSVPFALHSNRSGNTFWENSGSDIFYEFGRVGIGTSVPENRLTVDNGNGLIRGIDGWSLEGDQASLFLGDDNHSLSAGFSQGLRLQTFNTEDHDIRFGDNEGFDFMTLKMGTGNLGLGTLDPELRLDIRGLSPEEPGMIRLGNSNLNSELLLYSGHDNDPDPFILWPAGKALRFSTNQYGWSEKMRISTDGFVGIGTEDPQAGLHISMPLAGFFGQLCLTDPVDDDVAVTFHTGATYRSFLGYTNGYAMWATDEGSNMVLGTANSGNIGVKTYDPAVSLHVDGGYDVSLAGGGYFLIGDINGVNIGMDDNEIMARDNGVISYLNLNREGGNVIINELAGRVGIGTNNPTHKLSVNGTIRSKEVVVNTGWSDFVFEDDYDLRTLHELDIFIKENGHLPDIPSEKDVEENGVSLGTMDAKLLQKIEELTLYVLEINQKMELLHKENKDLKNDIERLSIETE